MPALPNPHPMVTFDPTRPADVCDQLNDIIIRWKPEWAPTWQDRSAGSPFGQHGVPGSRHFEDGTAHNGELLALTCPSNPDTA